MTSNNGLYGPNTGFETQQAQGISNDAAFVMNVAGPQLNARTGELGVPVWNGARYAMLSGTANAAYSYAYMRLFSAECGLLCYDETNPIVGQYFQIANGMELRWMQYNYQQSTMSLDILFTDGTQLRNYAAIVNQNGIRVHPALRGGYSLNFWYYFYVNLSPVAGKRIKTIYIAYDNGNNGTTGQFRGYFDNVHVVYPPGWQ